jgi:hypothetical protein
VIVGEMGWSPAIRRERVGVHAHVGLGLGQPKREMKGVEQAVSEGCTTTALGR